MSEHAKRKAARAMLNRAGYSMGGSLKGTVAKGVHEHEAALHKGKPKTKMRLKDGGKAEGEKPHHRADRMSRGGKSKGGKSHVTVNVINAHGGQKPTMMAPKPPMPMPPPGALAGPGGPPPGAGAPPPGMGGPPGGFKRGGRTRKKRADGGEASDSQRDEKPGMPDGHFRKGGKTKGKFPVPMTAGAGSALGRMQKAKDYGA